MKVISTSGTEKMFTGRRNRCLKIFRCETILYLKKLNKPMKPSSIRKTFPPKFLINLIGAGSFPGTSYRQRSVVLNPFNLRRKEESNKLQIFGVVYNITKVKMRPNVHFKYLVDGVCQYIRGKIFDDTNTF